MTDERTIRVQLSYDHGDHIIKIWVAGPHAAAGVITDALQGHHNAYSERRLTSIHLEPNVTDMPKLTSDAQ
jgi:hypothetical protein